MLTDLSEEHDDLLAELMEGVGDPDWLASLNQDMQATQLHEMAFQESRSMKRSESSPAFPLGGVDGSSTPVNIRTMVPSRTDDYSSLESNQSFLEANGFSSVPDDGFLGGHGYRRGSFKGGIPPPMPSSFGGRSSSSSLSKPNSLPAFSNATTVTVPARGGHWAWVPEPGSDGQPTAPPPSHPPLTTNHVPVKTGRLPLPLSMDKNDMDLLDMDILESFDVLEMANTLVFEPGGVDALRGNSFSRAPGSCPLPVLLEDNISDVQGSGDSINSFHNSIENDILASSPQSSGRVRSRPSGIPITRTRNVPMKAQRPAKSQSSPHLSSRLLASSCPTYIGDISPLMADGSMSLSDAIDDQDPDYSDSLARSHSVRSAGTAKNAKKKHHPWTVEETMALINGVSITGVGKWAEIKRLENPEISDVLVNRTAVDLKDKWRNLIRIAKLPKASLKARLAKSQSDIPLETMLQVKDLMEGGQSAVSVGNSS
jgi:hypothetical protein